MIGSRDGPFGYPPISFREMRANPPMFNQSGRGLFGGLGMSVGDFISRAVKVIPQLPAPNLKQIYIKSMLLGHGRRKI